MARFAELPDELLLQIASYHSPPPLPLKLKPFAYWSVFISQHRTFALEQAKHIKSLAHTNRRFFAVLYPVIHQNLFLRGVDSCGKLWDSIFGEPNPSERLGQSVKTVYLSDISPEQCVFIFFHLPNLRTVHLDRWSSWEAFDEAEYVEPGESLAGKSLITCLYLSNCGARDGPLKQFVSWPADLKELWLEADQGEWEGHVGGREPFGFRCSVISRALEPLWGSLEKFVFTRTDPNHEGLFYSDAIDLRKFEKLKELEIFQVLLVGYDPEHDIWTNLPASLESIGVWYDDAGYTNFLVDGPGGANPPEWLFGVLRRKKRHFPKLRKVRIVSIEWWDEEQAEWSDGEGGEGMETGMPKYLKEAFVNARVSYSIHLQETEKCWKEVVGGGASFDEDWDEKIIQHPDSF